MDEKQVTEQFVTTTAEEQFIEALQEITMAAGAFNRDPVKHMENCIRDMQRIAIDVLVRHGLKPLRAPVDEETE